jgi:hypothetical protein
MEVELITFVIIVVINGMKRIQRGITSGKLSIFQYQYLWVNAVNVLLKICVVGTQRVIHLPIGHIELAGLVYVGIV